MPPREVVPISVPKDGTRDVTLAPLEVEIRIERRDDIDPAFRRSAEVARAVSAVPPRLSSAFDPDERATLLEFARQFQAVFDHLRLAIGPETLSSDTLALGADEQPGEQAKLMVVQWNPGVFEAKVRGSACFFAPKPLLTELWHAKDVPIYPYVPGQVLVPPDSSPTLTNFAGADLERWAGDLLRRIDALLQPGLAVRCARCRRSSTRGW